MTILNTIPPTPLGQLIFTCFLLSVLAGVIISLICSDDTRERAVWGIVTTVLTFAVLVFLGAIPQSKEYKVQATIDETVSFEEINEKYEFVSKDGDIYTFVIRDKGG